MSTTEGNPSEPGPDEVRCHKCKSAIYEQAEICPECGTRQRAPPGNDDGKPLISAVISLVVPGLGQMYNREFIRGIAFMFAFYGGYFVTQSILGIGGFELVLFGVWAYAIYDAYSLGSSSDDVELQRRTSTDRPTGDSDWNQPTESTTTQTAGGHRDDHDRDEAGTESSPTAAAATSGDEPTVDRTDETVTESGVSTDGETTADAVAESSADSGQASDAQASTPAGTDDASADDDENGNDDDTDDSGSKWSRDDSDRSWSRN